MLGFYGFWSLYLHGKGAKTLAQCEEEAHEQRLRDLNERAVSVRTFHTTPTAR
jgi:hypothetical protein